MDKIKQALERIAEIDEDPRFGHVDNNVLLNLVMTHAKEALSELDANPSTGIFPQGDECAPSIPVPPTRYWKPHTVPDNGDYKTILASVRVCAEAWVPGMRLVGNVQAGDIVRAIDAVEYVIEAPKPAVSDEDGPFVWIIHNSKGKKRLTFEPPIPLSKVPNGPALAWLTEGETEVYFSRATAELGSTEVPTPMYEYPDPSPLKAVSNEDIKRVAREIYPPDTTNDGEPFYTDEQAQRNTYFCAGLRYARDHGLTNNAGKLYTEEQVRATLMPLLKQISHLIVKQHDQTGTARHTNEALHYIQDIATKHGIDI